LVSDDDSWDVLVKIEPILSLGENEIQIHNEVAEHHMAPEVYISYLCDQIQFPGEAVPVDAVVMVMEKMNGNWNQLVEKEFVSKEVLNKKLKQLVNSLHQLEIEHGALSPTNILYKKDGNEIELFLTDFTNSSRKKSFHIDKIELENILL
jgi:serine/threonine protein kinase